ncbi:hypothetical protein IXO599_19630, partial [Xanthomonas oryzae pv. oryzae]
MQLGEFLLAALGFDQVRDVADPDRGGVWVVVGVLHFAQQGVAVPVEPRRMGRVAFEHPSAQGIVAVVGDLPCLAAFGQAVVGVPAQFQVVGCGAVGAALANQVAGAVEDVVHAVVRALAGPLHLLFVVAADHLAQLHLLHARGQAVAGRVVEEAFDLALRVSVLQQPPDGVVAILIHALHAVAAVGQVAGAVVVVVGFEQRYRVLEHRLGGEQAAAVVGETAFDLRAELLAGGAPKRVALDQERGVVVDRHRHHLVARVVAAGHAVPGRGLTQD